jgi:hypothetical protein
VLLDFCIVEADVLVNIGAAGYPPVHGIERAVQSVTGVAPAIAIAVSLIGVVRANTIIATIGNPIAVPRDFVPDEPVFAGGRCAAKLRIRTIPGAVSDAVV